jgi:hypothetical protein
MMPYQSYQVYQAERPKTAAEIRRADEQLGHDGRERVVAVAARHPAHPLFRGQDRQPACSALLDATR